MHEAVRFPQTVSPPPPIQLAVINGLAPGGKLRENRMIALTATGLEFAGVLTRSDVFDAFRLMRRMKTLYHAALSDLMEHGREHHGDDFVQETMVQLEFDAMDAAEADAIGSLPPGCRHPDLTSAHYYVVSKEGLDDEESRRWLALAVEHRLSPIALGRAIRSGVLPYADHPAGENRRGGIATVQGLRMMFEVWERQVSKNDPMDLWDDTRLRSFLEEVAPIDKTIAAAKARLYAHA